MDTNQNVMLEHAVYEYTLTRKRIGEAFGDLRVPRDCADVFARLCDTLGYSVADQEHFLLMALDTKNTVIGVHHLYTGCLNTANLRVSEVLRLPIIMNAAAIAIAHNHPSGDTKPSMLDVNVTSMIGKAAKIHDIELLDHVIVGEFGYTSPREGAGWGAWS